MSISSEIDLLALLRQNFGFQEFRKGQLEAIRALFAHHRLLCIQPTGHGKSLLYQLPSCLLEGVTLVISPLLALMRDQIEHLHHRFQIPAASINSDQSEEENELARDQAGSGKLKVLFVSPEQLDHVDRFDFLLNLPISLIVIDEAHCISTWGHDFRPSYRQILSFVQAIEKSRPRIKILGLTATADERVERDIEKHLSSPENRITILRESMNRPNIQLSVINAAGAAEKLALCKRLLASLTGTGLIYCATRENTELVADYLKQKGLDIIAYHAGLEAEEKRRIQRAFSQGAYRVVAATTALGMGIDQAAIRFIIHFDIPGSITSYYQEVGRCGRDGLPAKGILLYDSHDLKIQEYFIESALPSKQDFDTVMQTVGASPEPLLLSQIKSATGLHPTRVIVILSELIEQLFIKKSSLKGSQVYQLLPPTKELDLSRYTVQSLIKREELAKMAAYAEQTRDCRMRILRQALGDKEPSPCGHCDLCSNQEQKAAISLEALSRTMDWLIDRPAPIAPSKRHRLSEGLSLLNGTLRPPLFIQFMKKRDSAEKLEEDLLALLKKQASSLAERHEIAALVPLPSRTWRARENTLRILAEHLQVQVLPGLLFWKTPPEKRQGELLNNDQRQQNVQGRMALNERETLPSGTLLLLDDYIGSGATMREAARTIREKKDALLVPLTIAAVRWRLGKPGFV